MTKCFESCLCDDDYKHTKDYKNQTINNFYKYCYLGDITNIVKSIEKSKYLIKHTINGIKALRCIIESNISDELKQCVMLNLSQNNLLDLNLNNGYALEMAVQKNNISLVNFLINNEVKITPDDDAGILLYYAAKQNNYDLFSLLKGQKGIKLNDEIKRYIKELTLIGDMKVAAECFG